MNFLWNAFKDGFRQSARDFFKPLRFITVMYQDKSWLHRTFTTFLLVYAFLSLGFILALFDKAAR
jgi:hypothetical protein